jgi:hypothetical protein
MRLPDDDPFDAERWTLGVLVFAVAWIALWVLAIVLEFWR